MALPAPRGEGLLMASPSCVYHGRVWDNSVVLSPDAWISPVAHTPYVWTAPRKQIGAEQVGYDCSTSVLPLLYPLLIHIFGDRKAV